MRFAQQFFFPFHWFAFAVQGGGALTIQTDDGQIFDCVQFGELNRRMFSMVRALICCCVCHATRPLCLRGGCLLDPSFCVSLRWTDFAVMRTLLAACL
jgi:hypothetical protein